MGTVTWSKGRRWIFGDDEQWYAVHQGDSYTALRLKRRVKFQVLPGQHGQPPAAVRVERIEGRVSGWDKIVPLVRSPNIGRFGWLRRFWSRLALLFSMPLRLP